MLSTQWKKSSWSSHQSACVEARLRTGGVEVRDSKNIHGPTLFAESGEWVGIIAATKRDEQH